jgi:hypothetical protein
MDTVRLVPDGVQARLATKSELSQLAAAEARLPQLRAPMLLAGSSDRVFVAALDGTSNNALRDPPRAHTIVAKLSQALDSARHPSIAVTYVPGVGTQTDYAKSVIDGITARSFHNRVEQAYYELCSQAAEWLRADPNARIHLVGIGFSRGAEQVAALERLVHQRGIRDPWEARVKYDSDGILSSIAYVDRPPLVPPGQTVQVALLHDPVATSLREHDRTLPPSNVSALGFTALHEARNWFEATQHLEDGLSERGRVANFAVPGAHADVGGSYLSDGIGRRLYNMDVDYLNTMLGERLLEKVPVAHDSRLYVIHQSDQHQYGLPPTSHFRTHGERRVHTDLGPGCEVKKPCTREAVDHRLAATVQWRNVQRGPTPGGTDAKMESAIAAVERAERKLGTSMLDRALAASGMPFRAEALVMKSRLVDQFDGLMTGVEEERDNAVKLVVRAYLNSPPGQLHRSLTRVAADWLGPWRAEGHPSLEPGYRDPGDAVHPAALGSPDGMSPSTGFAR